MTISLDQNRLATDEAAFAEQVRSHRRELHVHCYRMLGSVDDCEEFCHVAASAWQNSDGNSSTAGALRGRYGRLLPCRGERNRVSFDAAHITEPVLRRTLRGLGAKSLLSAKSVPVGFGLRYGGFAGRSRRLGPRDR